MTGAEPTLGMGAAVFYLNDRGVACGGAEVEALIAAGQIEAADSNLGWRPFKHSLDAWVAAHVTRARARKQRAVEGTVYLIRVGKLTKIGHTKVDLERRLRPLRAMNAGRVYVLQTHEGDRRLERALHREFAEQRDHGEWFRLPLGWERRVRLIVADYVLEHVA